MGIQSLIPGIVNPEATQYFKAVTDRFVAMGYVAGLTMQPLPYDFRMSSGYDEASKNLNKVVKKLKEFTNKKVIIIAHSHGNLKTAFNLQSMSQQDKDDNIKLFFAISPPFMGAYKPIAYLTCGSTEFFFPGNIGIDMKTWMILGSTFPAILELMPPTTYMTQKDQPWLQKVLARISYEAGLTSDPVYDFLPTRDQTCYPNFKSFKCGTGMEPIEYYGSYVGMKLNNTNIKQWMIDHSFSSNTADIYSILDNRMETLPNLGVPMVLVFSKVVDTEGKFVFNFDPKRASSQNRTCNKDEMTFSNLNGDDTVPVASVLTPGLKWAQEFIDKVPNAKPIKMLDVCSSVNVKTSPWDGKGSSGAQEMNKVEYQGLPCDCQEGKIKHCSHIGVLHNQALIEYVTNTVMSGDVQPVSPMVNSMTQQQLKDFLKTCKILMEGAISLVSSSSESAKPKTTETKAEAIKLETI